MYHAILETLCSPMWPNAKRAALLGGPPSRFTEKSDRRIPERGDQPVAVSVLLDVADRGEGEVEANHRCLLRRRHVVELVPGLLREVTVDIEGDVPVRIAQE